MSNPTLNCDRCLYVADFLVTIVRQFDKADPHTESWCWSCVSGEGDGEDE